jgi:arsenite methyltransferase
VPRVSDKAPDFTLPAAVGRLGLTDITVSGPLPQDLQNLLSWVVCVAGASTREEHVTTLERTGFTAFVLRDQGQALLDLVNEVQKKLLGLELDLGGLDLEEGKQLARRSVELIEGSTVGYTLITATIQGS